jgi:hypothetical protein
VPPGRTRGALTTSRSTSQSIVLGVGIGIPEREVCRGPPAGGFRLRNCSRKACRMNPCKLFCALATKYLCKCILTRQGCRAEPDLHWKHSNAFCCAFLCYLNCRDHRRSLFSRPVAYSASVGSSGSSYSSRAIESTCIRPYAAKLTASAAPVRAAPLHRRQQHV